MHMANLPAKPRSAFPGHPNSTTPQGNRQQDFDGQARNSHNLFATCSMGQRTWRCCTVFPLRKAGSAPTLLLPGRLSALKQQPRQRPQEDTWDSATACAQRMLCWHPTSKRAHTGWMQPPVMQLQSAVLHDSHDKLTWQKTAIAPFWRVFKRRS